MKKTPRLSFGPLLLILPGIAAAHPGHEAGAGFAAGVLHPLAGFDHLCALIAVGLLAGRMGGRAGIAVVVSFLAMLGGGIRSGLAGLELPLAEVVIAVSIVAVALLALRPPRRLPAATAALAGFFAVFHGHAHGAEAAEDTAWLAYSSGLLIASAALIAAGIALVNAPAWSRLRLQHRRD